MPVATIVKHFLTRRVNRVPDVSETPAYYSFSTALRSAYHRKLLHVMCLFPVIKLPCEPKLSDAYTLLVGDSITGNEVFLLQSDSAK